VWEKPNLLDALGVLNVYALYKSTHSLTHSPVSCLEHHATTNVAQYYRKKNSSVNSPSTTPDEHRLSDKAKDRCIWLKREISTSSRTNDHQPAPTVSDVNTATMSLTERIDTSERYDSADTCSWQILRLTAVSRNDVAVKFTSWSAKQTVHWFEPTFDGSLQPLLDAGHDAVYCMKNGATTTSAKNKTKGQSNLAKAASNALQTLHAPERLPKFKSRSRDHVPDPP